MRLRVGRRKDGYYVKDVEAGSSAQAAGLRKDDHILAVDGRDMMPLIGTIPMRLMSGSAGSVAEFKIERKVGKGQMETLPLHFLRGSAFPVHSPFVKAIGIDFDFGADKTTRAASVVGGSAAEKAGVRAGDTVMAVNEKKLSELSADELLREIQSAAGREIRLTVQHSGEDKPQEIKFLLSK